MLESRPPLGSEVDTQLPAVDETGATEAPRTDRLSYSRRSCYPAATVANFGSIHVAPVGSECAHGRGLVYQTCLGGSSARTRRRGAERDGPGLAEVPDCSK